MTKTARDLEIGDRFKDGQGIWRIVRSSRNNGLWVIIRDHKNIPHIYYPDDPVIIKSV